MSLRAPRAFASLVSFLLVRRSLPSPRERRRFSGETTVLAFARPDVIQHASEPLLSQLRAQLRGFVLERGELITHLDLPASAFARRSAYVKFVIARRLHSR